MKVFLLLVIAAILGGCASQELRYETPYRNATAVAPVVVEETAPQPTVIKRKESVQLPEHKRSAPLQTGPETLPPKGCIELRARQGAC